MTAAFYEPGNVIRMHLLTLTIYEKQIDVIFIVEFQTNNCCNYFHVITITIDSNFSFITTADAYHL